MATVVALMKEEIKGSVSSELCTTDNTLSFQSVGKTVPEMSHPLPIYPLLRDPGFAWGNISL